MVTPLCIRVSNGPTAADYFCREQRGENYGASLKFTHVFIPIHSFISVYPSLVIYISLKEWICIEERGRGVMNQRLTFGVAHRSAAGVV